MEKYKNPSQCLSLVSNSKNIPHALGEASNKLVLRFERKYSFNCSYKLLKK
jgi:hypothetical protein